MITDKKLLTDSLKEQAKCVVTKGGYDVVSLYTELETEYTTIRNHVALIDNSANGKFKVTGEEHVEFVNQFLSFDIEYLDIEKTTFAMVLNEEAQVIDLVTVYKQEDYLLIETSVSKRNEVFDFLTSHLENDEIIIEDLSDTLAAIAFEGPYAWNVGQQLIDFDISSLPFQSFVETIWNGETIVFARTGVTGEYGYKVLLSMESAMNLWNLLVEIKGDHFHVQPVGTEALTITMLEIRQPNIEFEANGLSVFESGLEWLFSFEKEEFIAMDAITELREQKVEKRLVGFVFDKEESLTTGDAIMVENENVGTVVQVEFSYSIDKHLALAVVMDEFAVSGLEMGALSSESGTRVEIKTVSSPYITPKSWAIKIV